GTAWTCRKDVGCSRPVQDCVRPRATTEFLVGLSLFSPRRAGGYGVDLQEGCRMFAPGAGLCPAASDDGIPGWTLSLLSAPCRRVRRGLAGRMSDVRARCRTVSGRERRRNSWLDSLSSLRAVPAGTAWTCRKDVGCSRPVQDCVRPRAMTEFLVGLSLFSPRRAGGY